LEIRNHTKSNSADAYIGEVSTIYPLICFSGDFRRSEQINECFLTYWVND